MNKAVFGKKTDEALCTLRKREYYLRQSEHRKSKLELYFCTKLLLKAYIDIRDEVTGTMSYSEYPYRKNGGRWFAMGQQYAPNYDFKKDEFFGNMGSAAKRQMKAKIFATRNTLHYAVMILHLENIQTVFSIRNT